MKMRVIEVDGEREMSERASCRLFIIKYNLLLHSVAKWNKGRMKNETKEKEKVSTIFHHYAAILLIYRYCWWLSFHAAIRPVLKISMCYSTILLKKCFLYPRHTSEIFWCFFFNLYCYLAWVFCKWNEPSFKVVLTSINKHI